MAVKHVVTQGVGFTVPSYILTDGFGDFSGSPPPAAPASARRRRRSSFWRRARRRR